MTILFANNASTTVAGSITPTDTTVNLAPGTGIEFPNPLNPGDFFVATFYDQATKTENEIVHVTHRSGDTCTIVRGQEGTTPQAWNAGDIFANLITAGTLASFVQSTAPAASTEIVYVGIDTSTDPTLIVANTTPVPASYQIGMLFVIKMLNVKIPPVTSAGPPPVTGSIMMQLNGVAGVAVKRTDGSDFSGGEMVGSEDYIFTYNGLSFTSTIMNVAQRAPQTVFYVNGTYGNDYNTGFSDNGTATTAAFKTIQGGMNRIKERYTSTVGITIRVADGTYTSGMADTENYIASWNIVGNAANPGNCIVDATSTNPASYVPNAVPGACVWSSGSAVIAVQGFTFKSYYYNLEANSGGNLSATDCHYSGGLFGGGCISASGGYIQLNGNANQFTSAVAVNGIWTATDGGVISMGGGNIFSSDPFACNFPGPTTVINGTGIASSGGVIGVDNAVISFSGITPTGPQFLAEAAGGLVFEGPVILPGTQPGVVIPPGYLIG